MWQLQTHLPPFCAWKSLLTCSAGAHTTSSANDPTTTTVRIQRRSLNVVLALRLLSELHRQFSRPLYVAFIDIKSAFAQSTEMRSGKHYVPEEYQIFF